MSDALELPSDDELSLLPDDSELQPLPDDGELQPLPTSWGTAM